MKTNKNNLSVNHLDFSVFDSKCDSLMAFKNVQTYKGMKLH